jgi:hypothetical protein
MVTEETMYEKPTGFKVAGSTRAKGVRRPVANQIGSLSEAPTPQLVPSVPGSRSITKG